MRRINNICEAARGNLLRAAYHHAATHLLLHFAFSFLCLSTALATDKNSHTRRVVFQPETTSIRWTLSGPIHTVHGTFKLKSGAVDINLGEGSADGLIEVDATSGESGNPARDGRMHKSILESDRYPIISFRPTRVIGGVVLSGDEVVTVEGAFRIHGAEHPLQLPIHIHPEGNAITLKSHFTVPYVDWGMKDPSIFVLRVDKTVDIEIEAIASANE
jgi:polyisoprenoid-binding protein YceI